MAYMQMQGAVPVAGDDGFDVGFDAELLFVPDDGGESEMTDRLNFDKILPDFHEEACPVQGTKLKAPDRLRKALWQTHNKPWYDRARHCLITVENILLRRMVCNKSLKERAFIFGTYVGDEGNEDRLHGDPIPKCAGANHPGRRLGQKDDPSKVRKSKKRDLAALHATLDLVGIDSKEPIYVDPAYIDDLLSA